MTFWHGSRLHRDVTLYWERGGEKAPSLSSPWMTLVPGCGAGCCWWQQGTDEKLKCRLEWWLRGRAAPRPVLRASAEFRQAWCSPPANCFWYFFVVLPAAFKATREGHFALNCKQIVERKISRLGKVSYCNAFYVRDEQLSPSHVFTMEICKWILAAVKSDGWAVCRLGNRSTSITVNRNCCWCRALPTK